MLFFSLLVSKTHRSSSREAQLCYVMVGGFWGPDTRDRTGPRKRILMESVRCYSCLFPWCMVWGNYGANVDRVSSVTMFLDLRDVSAQNKVPG